MKKRSFFTRIYLYWRTGLRCIPRELQEVFKIWDTSTPQHLPLPYHQLNYDSYIMDDAIGGKGFILLPTHQTYKISQENIQPTNECFCIAQAHILYYEPRFKKKFIARLYLIGTTKEPCFIFISKNLKRIKSSYIIDIKAWWTEPDKRLFHKLEDWYRWGLLRLGEGGLGANGELSQSIPGMGFRSYPEYQEWLIYCRQSRQNGAPYGMWE